MICKGGVFLIRRHNELRDHEADLLSMVCNDIEVEPVLQDIMKNSSLEGPIEHKTQDWTRTRNHSRSIASMKMKRSGCTRGGCWMFSVAR